MEIENEIFLHLTREGIWFKREVEARFEDRTASGNWYKLKETGKWA